MTKLQAPSAVESRPVVLVDAENVRRSLWPNISRDELVELCPAWAEQQNARIVVVFDGPAPGGDRELGQVRLVGVVVGSADDRIVQEAGEASARGDEVWLATSDRELRERVGNVARLLGGGSFARELVATRG